MLLVHGSEVRRIYLTRPVLTGDKEKQIEVARVVIASFPVVAPNGYLLAEAILILDTIHDGNILKDPNRVAEALMMSSMLRLIMAAVRKQWRDRGSGCSRS